MDHIHYGGLEFLKFGLFVFAWLLIFHILGATFANVKFLRVFNFA